ncbi:MAG: CvpA family protein [Eubacterium sp.]|nr:CvpA family protein [Eubacterium sp.]
MYHIVEAIAALIVIISVVDGWRRGLLLKLFGLARFAAMLILTIVLTPLLYHVLPLEPGLREGAAGLGALLLSVVLLIIVSQVLHIVDKIPLLNTVNRLGGAMIGLLIGVLAVWVALLIITSFKDISWCKTVTGYIKQSAVLSWFVHWNPLDLLS